MKNIRERIILGITGSRPGDWEKKIKEIDRLHIQTAALFLSHCQPKWRSSVYQALLASGIKRIPMVHLRDDMSREELKFLFNNFKTRYFTIHQDHFRVINNWRGYFKYLYLEFGLPLNRINRRTRIDIIGGLCVDCSHYMFEKTAHMVEAEYIDKRSQRKKFFRCNHLNGYDSKENADIHYLSSKRQLDYLKVLPKFIFGDVIGLEMENSIKQQLGYRDYAIKLLEGKH